MILLPDAVQNVKPLAGARVAVVVLFERNAIFARFVRPPGRNNIQSEAPIADLIDVGGLLRQQCGQMKRRPHRHHQLDSLRHRGQCRCRGPRIQRGRFDALDVIEVELGNQCQVKTNLLAALRKLLHVHPARLHVFVFYVAQPAAEDGEPVAVSHRGPPPAATRSLRFASCRCASAIRKSASRA